MHKIKLLLKEDSIKTRSGDYLIIYRPANLAIFVLVIRNGKNQNFYAKDDFNGRLIYLSKLNYAFKQSNKWGLLRPLPARSHSHMGGSIPETGPIAPHHPCVS